MPKRDTICSISVAKYIEQVESFHGYAAPGLIIGGFMVDLAYRHLPQGVLLDAISETETCLPDALQLLTHCTIGNGWLKVVNLGRFAVTLYDPNTGDGIRVYLNPAKLEKWPEIKTWFFKLIPKKEQDTKRLIKQIKEAGSDICDYEKVKVKLNKVAKKHRTSLGICPRCKESYPVADGDVCLGCQGNAPYLIN
ncbi:MAG: formylmethanofuran dehydrogenase subunit E family protein [Dehalococcoidales bacterium]|nr:formylmethanofuran dehydrogenase subunit E family protein [Dehalococcoidales bacterium]